MIKINYKPLSLNEAYSGKRYKTEYCRAFTKAVTLMVKPQKLPPPPYKISFIFGVSNMAADWDNPVKLAQDCIAKKLRFNDKMIYKGEAEKVLTEPGAEFIMYKLEHHTPINLDQLCGVTTGVKQI
jgi:hypothetical protein